MAIEAVNANTGVFPSPPLVYLPAAEPATEAAPPPPSVTAPAANPEAPTVVIPSQDASPPPPPVENGRGGNIDTTA